VFAVFQQSSVSEHPVARQSDIQLHTPVSRVPRLSRVLADEVSHLSTNTYGTVSYMAPELLGQGKFGKPADVYSFGLLSASRFAAHSTSI